MRRPERPITGCGGAARPDLRRNLSPGSCVQRAESRYRVVCGNRQGMVCAETRVRTLARAGELRRERSAATAPVRGDACYQVQLPAGGGHEPNCWRNVMT